jgi:hypothetical protein
MKNNKVDLFLDSGAFSAWSQGTSIDIDKYIAFIQKYKSKLTVYANLDVIGDPVGTWKNQKYMESKGLKPLPVFHTAFEDEKWLKKYIDKGYDYIALGGMAGGDIQSSTIAAKLDYLFPKYLCDAKGIPNIKVHGFGITSIPLLIRYPWYSVDSTSWVLTGRFGGIFIPKKKNGKYDYSVIPHKIDVSTRSSKVKEAGQHITTLSSAERKELLSYLSERGYVLGKSEFDANGKEVIIEEGICNMYMQRDEVNIMYFLDLEKNLPVWPWKFETKAAKGFGFL